MSNYITDKLSFGYWNICGAENKITEPDIIEQLNKHHIVILGETFLETHSIQLDGYKCKNVFRSGKRKKATRNYAGISVLIKNNITQFVKIVKITKEDFIWIRISKSLTGYSHDTFCCCAYIPPKGSPYYINNPDLNLFDVLNEDISCFSKLGHIMITGDLNASIGLKPETVTLDDFNRHIDNFLSMEEAWAPRRCSIDIKTTDWGKKLIDVCTAHNICLLNGRKLGDLEGRCTFYGRGSSAIDVTIVDRYIFSHTASFKVHKLTEFSDHCRIETILRCYPQNINFDDPSANDFVYDKYVWNKLNSLDKLTTAMSSPDFISLKEKIIKTDYPLSKNGCDQIGEDVNKLTKFLHDKCCDKKKVGKKSKTKTKKQKWFTPNCEIMRARVRRAANFLHRNPNNRLARAEYFSFRRKYKKLLKAAKKSHLEEQMMKLINSIDKTEMWSILSEIKGKKSGAPIAINELYSHFQSILNDVPKNIAENKLRFWKEKVSHFVKFNDKTTEYDAVPIGKYSTEKLTKLAKNLKNGKASFSDGTINEVIKHSIHDMSPVFVKFFNLLENVGVYPSVWNTSFLIPLLKKGCQSDPDNFRGLAVGSNISKFYSLCLNDKLTNYAETRSLLSPHQFGFRPDFRTSDAMFSLRSLISYYKNDSNKPVYSVFVDFSKAFDSVNRTALAFKLGKIGIRGTLLKLIIDMYRDTNYIIKSNGRFSVPFSAKFGVKQGCNLSPLFFNIFINDIHDSFDEPCKPLNINDWKVSSISYADDLVLLSESESGLQNTLVKLENYCNTWGLKVNIKKTKVVIFNKPFNNKSKKLHFEIDNKKLEVTNTYCYLGVDISNTGSFLNATDSLYKKGLRALYSIYSTLDVRSDVANTRLFLKLFDALVQPVVLYGCEIWGSHCLNSNNRLLTFVNKFYKTLIGVKQRSSNVGVLCELGRYPIEVNIAKAMIKYWFRLTSLPTNRLAAHCYWSLFNKNSLKDNWFDTIKMIINTTGQYDIWNNQVTLAFLQSNRLSKTQNYVIQALKDVYLQFANFKINSENKLYLFKNVADTQKISKYLTNIQGRNRRRAIANLRLGTLDIELEKGRHSGLDRDSRICKVCNLRKIESEEHFLFTCPALESVRKFFIRKISVAHSDFVNFSVSDQMKFLFFNNELDTDTLHMAADFLLALQNRRGFLMDLQNLLVKNQSTKKLKLVNWSKKARKIERVLKKNLLSQPPRP